MLKKNIQYLRRDAFFGIVGLSARYVDIQNLNEAKLRNINHDYEV